MKYYNTTTTPLTAIQIIDEVIASHEDEKVRKWVKENLRDPKEVIIKYNKDVKMKQEKDWKESIKRVEEIMQEQLETLKKLKELREENNDDKE